MDQEKLLKLQMQMRHNNDEYNTFLNDMESWTKQLKSKEEEIKSSNIDKNLPKIRNQCNKKPKIKEPRIKAYDYESWNKFDVDKALKNCDENNDMESNQNPNIEQSIELKELGNKYYKQGEYEKAVELYSRAIVVDNNNDIILSNRAMAHMKLGNYTAGLADCSLAIDINNKSVKAFYRRAKCRSFLSHSNAEIIADYQTVLLLQPDNKQAREELMQLRQQENTKGVVEPLYQPPINDRISSNKQLIRIDIVDVNPNINQKMEILDNNSTVKCPNPVEIIDNIETEHWSNKAATKEMENTKLTEIIDNSIEFRMPKTALQLAKDLSRYRNNWNHLSQYLVALNNGNYSHLIGQQLDNDLLLDLTNGLSWAVKFDLMTCDQFVESFNRLSKVSRFSFLWAMFNNDEKVHFNQVVSLLHEDLRNKLTGVV